MGVDPPATEATEATEAQQKPHFQLHTHARDVLSVRDLWTYSSSALQGAPSRSACRTHSSTSDDVYSLHCELRVCVLKGHFV
eukprot:1511840-Prymnesium_polylepis.1